MTNEFEQDVYSFCNKWHDGEHIAKDIEQLFVIYCHKWLETKYTEPTVIFKANIRNVLLEPIEKDIGGQIALDRIQLATKLGIDLGMFKNE